MGGLNLSPKNWIKFFILGLLWGSSFLWIKIAVQEVSPMTLVAFRTGFSVIALLIVSLFIHPKFRKSDLWILAVLGFFNVALPYVMIAWAEKHISSGMAAILNSTVPLFTILIAPLFLKDERLNAKRGVGLLLGFAGVIILMSNQLQSNDALEVIGVLVMLVAVSFYAGSGIFARKMNRCMDSVSQSLGQMVFSFLFSASAALSFEMPFHLPVLPRTYLAFAWLGILGSCVATLLWFSLINSVGPTRTSMVAYIYPLVGVVLGMLFLGESIDWRMVVGGVLIILAVGLVNAQKTSTSINISPCP
jgi:drug/metabolite transporter (DMT)-like permease